MKRRVMKRRVMKRTHDKREGAAMLIVLMVLIMATATATFAVHATTMEIRGAGHSRQAMQTSYVAEGGAYASLAYIDAVGARGAYTQYMRTRVAAGTSLAPNWPAIDRETNLLRIEMTDYAAGYDVVAPPIETALARGPSLGARNYAVPTFTVDGTDVYRHFPQQAGRDLSGRNPMMYARLNMTSRGSMAPPIDVTRAGDPRSYNQTSVNARAIAEMGPFPQ